ncbi:hypothetical protein A8C32_08275 [Flavivirga aquatica]|uniref:Secretion system C-terminal sorting domain-containing protein n=1 Tax=Flavivirga aquatica TaxID=1849968 RepID=A0A1E5SJ72_9FLAO|nr:T9SS type A sorting domain-containing protein [Flavivirga aquatica]OEJ99160.1 hypothetical protein A8C32_08275 [Flavivirga aquatica]
MKLSLINYFYKQFLRTNLFIDLTKGLLKHKQILGLFLICFFIQPFVYGQTKPVNNMPIGHQLYKSLKLKSKQNQKNDKTASQIDKFSQRLFYEFDHTCNPITREVPKDIHKKEEKFVQSKKSMTYSGLTNKKAISKWTNRGPYNIGGRTRALAIDISNENIILAGGVSGGLWRTEDGGKNWNRVTRKFQNPSITAIVQDSRPGYQHIWYYGGGEKSGNSASVDPLNFQGIYTGAGIYKSQDNGRTWELLPSTVDNLVGTISTFDIVNSMVVNPINGDLYVATFNSIQRSQDGGKTFQEVFSDGIDYSTEIAVTSKGKFYISSAKRINSFLYTNMVYTSDNGTNWSPITENLPLINNAIRTIFAINPSNEDEVYFFSAGTFFNSLYRYNAFDQTFVDLTDKTPISFSYGSIDGLITQGGYNMVIAVHPKNPDFIIIGGTNLFRTIDGFKTNLMNTPNHWIGGYSPLNDVSIYPNNHPDNHSIKFFPSNPNKVLNANDGGVFITEDITSSNSFEEPVKWGSLNNGYITTQPYAISFDPTSKNEDLLAGFQDNGSWFTDQSNIDAVWKEQFSGDGSYSAFADNGRTRYISSQFGNILRFNLDDNGNTESIAFVQPAGLGPRSFSFINPFVLDPNNDNVIYLPAKRKLFRNSNLDELPTASEIYDLKPSEINWSQIAEVEESITDQFGRELNVITAIDVATFPEANKVYYGTGQGQVFRLDFADLTSSKPVDIFTGKGLPEKSYLSSIHVDPNDSDRVVISFSNYNIPSIFYTKDAGETWIDISGNLEEKRDGTGNGPSVRWVSFLGNKDGILAGTSSGLYYSDRINEKNTVWRLENNQIGNGVVVQVRTRQDGFAAVAVHGNGVFSKKFDVTPPSGKNTLFVNKKPENIELPTQETPEFITLDLSEVFKEEQGNNIDITIENLDKNGDFIRHEFFNNQLDIYFPKANSDIPNIDKEGESIIRLIATSGIQKVATEIKIKVFYKPLLDRFDPDKRTINLARPSTQAEATSFTNSEPISVEVADIFNVPKGESWSIERMKIIGKTTSFSSFSTPGNRARVRIYKDDNGRPGEQIADILDVLIKNPLIFSLDTSELDFFFPSIVELKEGKYWISFARLDEIYNRNNVSWQLQIRLAENPEFVNEIEADFENKPNPHVRVVEGKLSSFTGITKEWKAFENVPNSNFFPNDGKSYKAQLVFSLFGEVKDLNSVEKPVDRKVSIIPNPTNGRFKLDFDHKLNENVLIRIINMTDNEVFRKKFDSKERNYEIDCSSLEPGIYVVVVKGKTIEKRMKMVYY